MLSGANTNPHCKKIQLKAVINGKIGPTFNHTIVTGDSQSIICSKSIPYPAKNLAGGPDGYENFESLKDRRMRIMELKKKDSLKPPQRVSVSLAAYFDQSHQSSFLLVNNTAAALGPDEKHESSKRSSLMRIEHEISGVK